MKKASLLIALLLVFNSVLFAQVGINADNSAPDNSAMLDVKSTSGGMLVPRMTAAQRDAISNPANGLLIFCTDNNQYYYRKASLNGGNWVMLNSQWVSNGSGIFYNGGNVGIGYTNPAEKLDVVGAIRIGNSSSVCDAAHRGAVKFVPRESGAGDDLFVCRKQASGTYAWDRITFGGSETVACDYFDRAN